MLLAIDVGNTNVTIGVYDGARLAHSWRLAALRERTADELGIFLIKLFEQANVPIASVDGIAIASVVPPLTRPMEEMCERYFHHAALVIEDRTGLVFAGASDQAIGAHVLRSGIPGFTLELYADEGEGYYLNLTSGAPVWFVMWRIDEGDGSQAHPEAVSLSYNEAGRWLDGGHSVDGVAMPAEIYAWVGEYVEQNYRPEPKKRIKPRSFIHPKDRV